MLPALFDFIFSDRISWFSWGWPQVSVFLLMASCAAGIIKYEPPHPAY
jgi:hypothetical protein